MTEMFMRRLAYLICLRGMCTPGATMLGLIEWAIYSTRMDLRALGAGDRADALMSRWRR